MHIEAYIDATFFRRAAVQFLRLRDHRVVPANDVRPLPDPIRKALATIFNGDPDKCTLRWYEAVASPAPLVGGPDPKVQRDALDRLNEQGVITRAGGLAPSPYLASEVLRDFRAIAKSVGPQFHDGLARIEDILLHLLGDRPKQINTLIAIDLVVRAAEDKFDLAVLLAGDSDLVPAVTHVSLPRTGGRPGRNIALGTMPYTKPGKRGRYTLVAPILRKVAAQHGSVTPVDEDSFRTMFTTRGRSHGP